MLKILLSKDFATYQVLASYQKHREAGFNNCGSRSCNVIIARLPPNFTSGTICFRGQRTGLGERDGVDRVAGPLGGSDAQRLVPGAGPQDQLFGGEVVGHLQVVSSLQSDRLQSRSFAAVRALHTTSTNPFFGKRTTLIQVQDKKLKQSTYTG